MAQPAFEGACGLLSVEVEEQVGGGGEECGVSGEDGLMGDVLGQHRLSEAVRTDEDDIVAAVEEVEGEDALEGGSVQCGGPIPVPVGEWLESSESGALEPALDTAAVLFFEFVGDDAFEQDGGAPALAGGRGDEVVELVGGVAETEAPEVSLQRRRRGRVVRGHRRTPGHGSGRRGHAVRVGRAG